MATVFTIRLILLSPKYQNLLKLQLLGITWASVSLILNVLPALKSHSQNVHLITKKWTWLDAKLNVKYLVRIWEPLIRSCKKTGTLYKSFRKSSYFKTRLTTWTAKRVACTEYPPKRCQSTTTTTEIGITRMSNKLTENHISSRRWCKSPTSINNSTTKHSNMNFQWALLTTPQKCITKVTMSIKISILNFKMIEPHRLTFRFVNKLSTSMVTLGLRAVKHIDKINSKELCMIRKSIFTRQLKPMELLLIKDHRWPTTPRDWGTTSEPKMY